MPGRKFTNGNGYRYGFNGKENDNEVNGEGNQQDYGMRIFDPRLGRFLSVDPLTKKFPDLTPYQFASNCPIAGVDRDGLEFMKYDKANTGTIVFNREEVNSDKIIKAEYEQAMKSNMNVVLSGSIPELNKFLKEKGTKYAQMLFSGHGFFNRSKIKMVEQLSEANIDNDRKSDLQELSKYINKDGTIVLLACFQAVPPTLFDNSECPTCNSLEIVTLNGEKLAQKISIITGRKVLASAGEVSAPSGEFSGKVPLVTGSSAPVIEPVNNSVDLNKKYVGKWTLFSPEEPKRPIYEVKINPDGTLNYYQKVQPWDIKPSHNENVGNVENKSVRLK